MRRERLGNCSGSYFYTSTSSSPSPWLHVRACAFAFARLLDTAVLPAHNTLPDREKSESARSFRVLHPCLLSPRFSASHSPAIHIYSARRLSENYLQVYSSFWLTPARHWRGIQRPRASARKKHECARRSEADKQTRATRRRRSV